MKNRNKKECIIIGAMLILAIAVIMIMRFAVGTNKAYVVVSVGGSEYGTYDLRENQEIEIHSEKGINILKIENGQARMIEASCPDKICMGMTPLEGDVPGVIVCLPNEVIVELRE